TVPGIAEPRQAGSAEQITVPLPTNGATIEDADTAIQKGRREVRTARAAKDDDKKIASQRKAREFFDAARAIYQAEHDRHKAEYDKFDKFIPRSDKARFEAREEAYLLYIQAQL